MGDIWLVPTPVGNLEDITLRALNILREVDMVFAEDTRKTKNLLDHYNIQKKIQSHHKFNEHQSVKGILKVLGEGLTIALVSDAGTPGISDPGFLLVRESIKAGATVKTLPGPTAFLPALVNSGLPCDRFVFEGFLPRKKGRQKRLGELAREERTMVFYESPQRVVKSLEQFEEFFGPDRPCSISREISKMHEETLRGCLAEVKKTLETGGTKGEFVIVLGGKGAMNKT